MERSALIAALVPELIALEKQYPNVMQFLQKLNDGILDLEERVRILEKHDDH